MSNLSGKTDFEILGISADSSLDELKAIYKRKVLRAHPDKGGNIAEFHRIQTAYHNVKNILGFKRPSPLFNLKGPPSFKKQKCQEQASDATARDSVKSDPVARPMQPTFHGIRTVIDSIKSNSIPKTKLKRESSQTTGKTLSSAVEKNVESKAASVKLPSPTSSVSSSSTADPAVATGLPTKADTPSSTRTTADAARSTMNDIARKINQLLKARNVNAGAEIPEDALENIRVLLNQLERSDRKLVLRAMSAKRASVIEQLEAHVRRHKEEKVINEICSDMDGNPTANLVEEKLEEIRMKLAPLDREQRKSLLQRLTPSHIQQLEAHMLRHRKEAKPEVNAHV